MSSTRTAVTDLGAAHATWWGGLESRTRLYLLTCRRDADLPLDVWRDCVGSALVQGSAECDGWLGVRSARRLPPTVARYVGVLRGAEELAG